jgi:saccharopine dehydrogenase (NADP+, L-glutamate forming)
VKSGKHLVTASYVTDEIKALDAQAKEKGILLLNECGLDPGIDHMSAMKVIDRIRQEGGEIVGFESFTGGLLAPNDKVDNPWQYKFTWNPRNVVLAGTGGVKFLQDGKFKYIPHHKIFRRIEIVHIPGYGYFEGYANRDSLGYREVYDLKNIKTMYRGTFRRQGFCKTWSILVQLGACDDSYQMEEVDNMTHRQFINSFLSYNPDDSIELKLAHYMNIDLDSDEMNKLKWSGFFSDELVGLKKGTPAQILEHILKKKWTLDPDEKDMIVMYHKFNFMIKGNLREIHATMVAIGDDRVNTAMSKTVGLPMGIATKLLAEGKITARGVKIPIEKGIYSPILSELKGLGFDFIEEEIKKN